MTMPSTEPKTEPLQIPLLELPSSPEPPPASKPSACPAAVGKAMSGSRRYQRGAFDPRQEMLPPRVEDFVDRDNPVRAIAAHVDSCDLAGLGLTHSAAVRVAVSVRRHEPHSLRPSAGAGMPAQHRTDLAARRSASRLP
jgi:hypothetical protein